MFKTILYGTTGATFAIYLTYLYKIHKKHKLNGEKFCSGFQSCITHLYFVSRFPKKLQNLPKHRPEINFPDTRDYEATVKFMLDELQIAEDYFLKNDINNAMHHLANAVVISKFKHKLLETFKESLMSDTYVLFLIYVNLALKHQLKL